MTSTVKIFLLLGSVNAALAVILGAFAAHSLKHRLSVELLAVFQTGVQYHLFHSLGLVLAGLTLVILPAQVLLKWSGWIMFSGIVLFSGSLYLLALAEHRWVGIITPFGGSAFIIAWLCYATAVFRA